MRRIRVLVVEDSPTIRHMLIETLAADPAIEVVADAEDGKRAVELCRLHAPDVITMDMMMPVMTGLAATEYIMAHQPTPILIVSASVNRGEVFKIYDALAAGAVDVLEKPTVDERDGEWERRLLSAVKLVAKIKVITHPKARLSAPKARTAAMESRPHDAPDFNLVAIGASTGGPAAVAEILRGLPRDFDLPVLVVVHMNAPFGAAFIDWLDAQVERPVTHPQHGMVVGSLRGRVLVAPADHHMIVRGGKILLNRDPERHSCRPSVDVLFESIAAEHGAAAIGCLLTGMGRDGASGLLAIRNAGGMTIAQDEASSVIFGMPREAIALGAAKQILPLGEIGPRIVSLRARVAETVA
jgi:two-component system chemotaxis response regulator CheB